MAQFTASEIDSILGGANRLLSEELTVSSFAVDSRSVTAPAETLFFAIKTDNNDGHRYIPELYRRGTRNFVVTEAPEGYSDCNFFIVTDAVEALQRLAAAWRDRLHYPIIAVTGSRGKTEVKEWIYAILKTNGYHVCRSPRSYNSQIGVALSVLGFDRDSDFGIIEAGISQSGEMARIASMVRPETGVITNVTDEHSSGFASRSEHIAEKLKLFTSASSIIYQGDSTDTALTAAIAACFPDSVHAPWTFSNDVAYESLTRESRTGYELDNRITAIRAAETVTGRSLKIPRLYPVATRIVVEKGENNCMILGDGFTHDLQSLDTALDFVSRRLTPNRSLTLIIGPNDNGESREDYRRLARLYGASKVIEVESVDDFKSKYSTDNFSDEVILVKGRPSDGFDRIMSLLEAKQHETVMEINLDNLVHNFNFFKSRLPLSTGIIVMLKADGYGCGALELAKTLQSQGAAAIAVAVADEGIELRKAGITMPIIVLNPRIRNYSLMLKYCLEPEIYSLELLHDLYENLRMSSYSGMRVHLKLDTGMHRLGFSRGQLPQVVEALAKYPGVEVGSVFSHLATADCFDMNDYTQYQLDYFADCVRYLRANLGENIKAHILNTAGILRYPEHHYDFARLGIGLYGLPVLNDGSEKEIRPVAALYSTVIAVASRHKGDSIGYGRRGRVDCEREIATVPIGYADGIDRHLGNGNAQFVVNGKRCPTIGNICMDICMIDVTGTGAKVGDRVEIFGHDVPLTELSDTLGTIPYEILTSISPRVKRVYYRE